MRLSPSWQVYFFIFQACSDFSMSAFLVSHSSPRHVSPPSPPHLSAQPGERATGLQGD